MINYLFCLDSNYNNQFLTSLFSIDKNSKKDFNVYVIHKDPETLNTLLKKYKNLFTNLNNMKFINLIVIMIRFRTYKTIIFQKQLIIGFL